MGAGTRSSRTVLLQPVHRRRGERPGPRGPPARLRVPVTYRHAGTGGPPAACPCGRVTSRERPEGLCPPAPSRSLSPGVPALPPTASPAATGGPGHPTQSLKTETVRPALERIWPDRPEHPGAYDMGTTPDQQPSLRADALLAERRQWAAVMDRLDEGLRHDVPVVDALRAAANVDTRGEAQLRTAIDAGLRAHVAAEHGRLDRYPPTDGDYHDARQNQAYADAEARSYDDGRQFDTHAEHRGDR